MFFLRSLTCSSRAASSVLCVAVRRKTFVVPRWNFPASMCPWCTSSPVICSSTRRRQQHTVHTESRRGGSPFRVFYYLHQLLLAMNRGNKRFTTVPSTIDRATQRVKKGYQAPCFYPTYFFFLPFIFSFGQQNSGALDGGQQRLPSHTRARRLHQGASSLANIPTWRETEQARPHNTPSRSLRQARHTRVTINIIHFLE